MMGRVRRPMLLVGLIAIGLVAPQAAAGSPVLAPAKNVSVLEGERATVTVRLPAPAQVTTTVKFATKAGTATARKDFRPRHGTLTLRKGSRRAQVVVLTKQDAIDEQNETFQLRFSGPVMAHLGDVTATTITILDDDLSKATVSNLTVKEPARKGSSVPIGAVVTITGKGAGAGPANLGYEIIGVEPTADKNDADLGSGRLHFAKGETSKVIPGSIHGDALDEGPEHLLIVITGDRYVDAPGPDATVT
ncbi:MAG: large repetitive protein, partial [Solirubrobacteraceae bacterium]|nr:large repetitive protein [Solirubrobacteraceae bacterium]